MNPPIPDAVVVRKAKTPNPLPNHRKVVQTANAPKKAKPTKHGYQIKWSTPLLWRHEKIKDAIKDITTLHLLSFGDAHEVQWEDGASEHKISVVPHIHWSAMITALNQPAEIDATLYPSATERMSVSVYDHSGSKYPIPMVAADRCVVELIWDDAQKSEPPSNNAFWYIASHGGRRLKQGSDADGQSAEIVAYYTDNAGEVQTLNEASIAAMTTVPKVVVVGCCLVGQVADGADGEPAGLLSALAVRGTRKIVAPVKPIDDLAAAVFMVHFHHHWKTVGDPTKALLRLNLQMRHSTARVSPCKNTII